MGVLATFEYTPGDATAVVGSGVVVMVDLEPQHELVGALFAALQRSAGVDDVLEVLLSPGLRAVASFGVARPQIDGTRVVVRGEFQATVSGAGPVVGEGLWRDSFLEQGTRVVLSRGDPHHTGVSLPIVAGVVRAETVLVQAGVDRTSAEPPSQSGAGVRAAGDPADPVFEPVPPPPPPPTPPAPAPPAASVGNAPSPAGHPEPSPFAAIFAGDGSANDGADPAPPGLIQEVPWASGRDVWLGSPEAPGPVAFPQSSGSVLSSPPSPVPPPATLDTEAAEMTVNRRQLIDSGSGSGPLVIAARCPQGHLSAAYAGSCRVCREPLPAQQPFEAPRPPLGVLRLSTGDVVTLDRGAVLGRSPRLPSGFVGEQPNLVRLNDPGKDVSSQHLEVSLDYWHVLVKDLGSTNGTEVILPGEAPVQLHAHDAMAIEPGTRVVLAGVMEFVFEVTG